VRLLEDPNLRSEENDVPHLNRYAISAIS